LIEAGAGKSYPSTCHGHTLMISGPNTTLTIHISHKRSEERRVGKEC